MTTDRMALWGGVECSVNRVGDGYQDQMELSGHASRGGDLQLIHDLGIRTVRYPVLWERTAPRSPAHRNWRWPDQRLNALRSLAMDPIVGLLHHGSGPRYTGLLEDNFAPELAQFAFDVASRYPWVNQYTPINEPLTTARFSALYGHWYPHHRKERSFARALINQCKGIALSMAAIRQVNPHAQLVQTEDLGTTFSTPQLHYQRDFDNDRRWLSWDILCGRVDRGHNLRSFLERAGIPADDLDWFVLNPCPPQVLGINHYVTSDRFLDTRLTRYPRHTHGRNGREAYADVEAVRVLPQAQGGWDVIQHAADRYHLPIALTEVHIGCTREEQLRWFQEAWRAAGAARASGCDVRAVTAWSLFGAFHWNTLLTRDDGTYEPGAFDIRAPAPRPTALAAVLARAVRGAAPLDAQLDSAGWWRRPDKIIYDSAPCGVPYTRAVTRPLLIAGAQGALGRALILACEQRNLHYRALSRRELDITQVTDVDAVCAALDPWAIINAAGYASVDRAELDRLACFEQNCRGAHYLAAAANTRQIPFLTFSSHLVFDGSGHTPYLESSVASPASVYGRSKLAGEDATLLYPGTLCIRTAAFFGTGTRADFLSNTMAALAAGRESTAFEDVTISPTYLPDLARESLDLLLDRCSGLLHLVNRGAITWADFAARAARAAGIDAVKLVRQTRQESPLGSRRPQYSALASERVAVMPTLDDAMERFAVAYRMADLGARAGRAESTLCRAGRDQRSQTSVA